MTAHAIACAVSLATLDPHRPTGLSDDIGKASYRLGFADLLPVEVFPYGGGKLRSGFSRGGVEGRNSGWRGGKMRSSEVSPLGGIWCFN